MLILFTSLISYKQAPISYMFMLVHICTYLSIKLPARVVALIATISGQEKRLAA